MKNYASIPGRDGEPATELNLANAELLRQIAERQIAEQAQVESEKRFQTIFNQGLVGIAQTDLTGRTAPHRGRAPSSGRGSRWPRPRRRPPANPMSALRVVLVDDHALVRAGLRVILEKLPGVSVVGEAENGRAALKLVNTVMPHLLFLDISMAELGGLEILPRLVSDFPSVKVLILSAHANEEYVLRALRCGACGYLLEDAAAEELGPAVNAVARGQIYLSPAVSRTVVEAYLKRAAGDKGPVELLTGRQREVLQLIAEGGSTKEIAHLLGISIKTVEAHRSQIMDRLDIHDVAGLVRYAVRSGMISADQ